MVRINLLPVRVSKKKEAGKQQLILFALVLVLGIVVNWIAHERREDALTDVNRRVQKAQSDIATLDKIIGQVKEITSQQEQLKKKLATLDQLRAGRNGPVRMMDELSGLIPRRVWIRKMEEKGGKMTIQGSAINIDDVSRFMSALKGSRYFADAELKKTQAKVETKVHETLRMVEYDISVTCRYTASPPATAGAPGGVGGKG